MVDYDKEFPSEQTEIALRNDRSYELNNNHDFTVLHSNIQSISKNLD